MSLQPEWHARATAKNPPGTVFTHGDPLGRHRLPRKRSWGAAVWGVHTWDDGQARWSQYAGARHLSRDRFRRLVILPVLAVAAVLLAVLVVMLWS